MAKYTWNLEDIRIVYAICQKFHDNTICNQKVQQVLGCTIGSAVFAVNRYVARYNGTLDWSADPDGPKDGWAKQGIKWNDVWEERDWRRKDE